jgi:hypothetical protein
MGKNCSVWSNNRPKGHGVQMKKVIKSKATVLAFALCLTVLFPTIVQAQRFKCYYEPEGKREKCLEEEEKRQKKESQEQPCDAQNKGTFVEEIDKQTAI